MFYGEREITTSEAADLLSLTPRHVTELLRSGSLLGRQLASGVWLTSHDALARFTETTSPGRGRTLKPDTAWGMLWELSGLRADWLTSSTRSRVHSQISELSAADIVRAVAGRTRASHYVMDSPPTSSVGLISTGRPVAGDLRVGLGDSGRFLAGYVRQGTVSAYADAHGMRPDYDGPHILLESTLPIEYARSRMPNAVIAADLTRSTMPLERRRGVQAMERVRRTWLESH